MHYAINLNIDNRVLSATYQEFAPETAVIVDELPTGETEKEKDITNWLYVDGQYQYNPLPDPEPPEPSEDEIWKQETDEAICELYEMMAGGDE